MQVFQSLFYKAILGNVKIDMELCILVVKEVILENRAYIDELIQKVKSRKHLYEILYSIANNLPIDIPPKSLYNAHIILEDMGFIRNIGRGKYEIVDIFLQIFLQQDDANMLIDSSRLKIWQLENNN